MPHRSARLAACAMTAVLALAPSAALAKSSPTKTTPSKTTTTNGGDSKEGSCSQAFKASNKKPFDTLAIDDTKGCFENFIKQTNRMAETAQGYASGCQNAQGSREAQGKGLIALGKAGNDAVAITKKAKAEYFTKEEAYYEHSAEMKKKLGAAATGIGKVGFAIDGFYSNVAGIGSAIANDDCDEAQTKATAAAKQAAKASDEADELYKALEALEPAKKKK